MMRAGKKLNRYDRQSCDQQQLIENMCKTQQIGGINGDPSLIRGASTATLQCLSQLSHVTTTSLGTLLELVQPSADRLSQNANLDFAKLLLLI